MLHISDFSRTKGLNLNKDNQSISYLYGLSDFWQFMFQDATSTNLLLEASSLEASNIYDNFLKLTTGLSVADILDSATSQIQLNIISDTPTLPTNVPITSGTFENNFGTIKVKDIGGFAVGDIVSISGVQDMQVYSTNNSLNTTYINSGSTPYFTLSAAKWNSSFTITAVDPLGYLTFYSYEDLGKYTFGGMVTTSSIGVNTYLLPIKSITSRLIANKPFLPNVVLEENVDYIIDANTPRLILAADISSYGFPVRMSGYKKEYSLWFVDTSYDEDLIYEHFPKLLGRAKLAISNADYRAFLIGLFYVYTGGPSLTVLTRGLNVLLGVPTAIGAEEVLDIQFYLASSKYVVITDTSSYVLPAGISPSVSVGQVLTPGQELAKYLEIMDFTSHGYWWRNNLVEIPKEIMPFTPTGFSRVVTGALNTYTDYSSSDNLNLVAINDGGSENGQYQVADYADWLMTNYLKNNTFLVKVYVTAEEFKSVQKFESIYDFIKEIKPSSSFPVYSFNTPNTRALSAVISTTSAGKVSTQVTLGSIGSTISSVSVGSLSPGLLLAGRIATGSVGAMGKSVVISLAGITSVCSPGVCAIGSALTSNSSTGDVGTVIYSTASDVYQVNTQTSVGSVTPSIV